MSKQQVTYTGTAGRYYVKDKSGKRWYFPRGKSTTVPESVAALLPKSKDLKINPAPAGSEETR